jgi:hypothetical protein
MHQSRHMHHQLLPLCLFFLANLDSCRAFSMYFIFTCACTVRPVPLV